MKHKKSAKDLAFEKERGKFRKEIRELERQVAERDKLISDMEQAVSEKDEEIRTQAEWIQRLLEYMDMPEEEMRELVLKKKVIHSTAKHVEWIIKSVLSSLPEAAYSFPAVIEAEKEWNKACQGIYADKCDKKI